MNSTLATAAAAAFIVVCLLQASNAPVLRSRRAWLIPATISAVFAAFSLVVILQEGVFGFWTEHTSDLWGNQIWMDLLLAVGVAWTLLLPRMRALNMRLIPWLALLALTGSIGLCALLARSMYLEATQEPK